MTVQEYQAEHNQYVYEPVFYAIDVSQGGSSNFNMMLELYFNKTRAAMIALLVCSSELHGFPSPTTWGRALSAKHFISMSTDIPPDGDCTVGLFAGSLREEVISYRLRVSGLAGQRPTKTGSPWSSPDSNGFAPSWSSESLTGWDAIAAREQAILAAALSR